MTTCLAAACSSSGSTCVLRTAAGEDMACIDYAGSISAADVKASCEAGGGTVDGGSCDESTALGRCENFGSTTWYYPPYLVETGTTVTDLRSTCEAAGGTFTE